MLDKNIPLIAEMRDKLNEQYFEWLESELVNPYDYEDIGQGYTDLVLKPEYDLSDDEMAKELDFVDFADYIQKELAKEGVKQPDWVTDWTRAMIGGAV